MLLASLKQVKTKEEWEREVEAHRLKQFVFNDPVVGKEEKWL